MGVLLIKHSASLPFWASKIIKSWNPALRIVRLMADRIGFESSTIKHERHIA
jgi:hypothetical protein